MATTSDVNERGIFQLPRPTWLLDKDVNECVECKSEFTTFNRKVPHARARGCVCAARLRLWRARRR